jgi:hypothetical protein
VDAFTAGVLRRAVPLCGTRCELPAAIRSGFERINRREAPRRRWPTAILETGSRNPTLCAMRRREADLPCSHRFFGCLQSGFHWCLQIGGGRVAIRRNVCQAHPKPPTSPTLPTGLDEGSHAKTSASARSRGGENAHGDLHCRRRPDDAGGGLWRRWLDAPPAPDAQPGLRRQFCRHLARLCHRSDRRPDTDYNRQPAN